MATTLQVEAPPQPPLQRRRWYASPDRYLGPDQRDFFAVTPR